MRYDNQSLLSCFYLKTYGRYESPGSYFDEKLHFSLFLSYSSTKKTRQNNFDFVKELIMPLVEVDFINPVISSLEDTFDTMLSCKLTRVGLELKGNNTTLYPISGIVGISGRFAIGTVVLSLSEEVALKAASTMLMTEITEADEDVMDAVGELTNMISGASKAKLSQYNLSMGLPSVFHGTSCRIHFPSSSHPISIPFECPWGKLALEVGFSFKG